MNVVQPFSLQQFDDIETLLHIISSGYDVNKLFDNTLEYPIALATREGSIRSIKTILDAGADPNKTDMHGRNALHVAIEPPCPTGNDMCGV